MAAVLLAAVVSSLTAASLGYDVGIMADANVFIGADLKLNSLETQMIVGSLNFIAAFGTLIAGSTSDRFGRKPTVMMCCVLYIVGAVVMALARGSHAVTEKRARAHTLTLTHTRQHPLLTHVRTLPPRTRA